MGGRKEGIRGRISLADAENNKVKCQKQEVTDDYLVTTGGLENAWRWQKKEYQSTGRTVAKKKMSK